MSGYLEDKVGCPFTGSLTAGGRRGKFIGMYRGGPGQDKVIAQPFLPNGRTCEYLYPTQTWGGPFYQNWDGNTNPLSHPRTLQKDQIPFRPTVGVMLVVPFPEEARKEFFTLAKAGWVFFTFPTAGLVPGGVQYRC